MQNDLANRACEIANELVHIWPFSRGNVSAGVIATAAHLNNLIKENIRMLRKLVRYMRLTEIVGDIIRIKWPSTNYKDLDICFSDLALDENSNGYRSIAQVIRLEGDMISLQVFGGTKCLSTKASVRFFGHGIQVIYSPTILVRIFRGDGRSIDGGLDLPNDSKSFICSSSINPVKWVLSSKIIHTDVPMIDLFNCLVESQKIPIFSVAGDPYNSF